MSFNPHNDPVARELHNANETLRGIQGQLWEQSQPAEVRAALQADRAQRAHAASWGVRILLGIAAAWVLLSLVFGQAGQRLFGSLLGFAWDALGALMVLGAVVWVGSVLLRGARAVGLLGRRGRDA